MTTQIHEIYIRATPEAIWEALTTPEWTARYGYRTQARYELKQGGKYLVRSTEEMLGMGLPAVIIDGEVIEAQAPRKLVHTVRFLFSAANEAEGFTRITWEIVPTTAGFCRLTVTHEMKNAPIMASATSSKVDDGQGGGGWTFIISDLKSLLETGRSIAG